LVQPFIVALAAAIPFIEGEGAAGLGIVGGVNPVAAVIAGVLGNFLCVAALVLLSSSAHNAVVTRHRNRVRAAQTVYAGGQSIEEVDIDEVALGSDEPVSGRKAKFLNALNRYGVPGVSLLGPLLLPTHFTATMLAAVGVSKGRVLFWQALAIIGWTTVITLIITGALSADRKSVVQGKSGGRGGRRMAS